MDNKLLELINENKLAFKGYMDEEEMFTPKFLECVHVNDLYYIIRQEEDKNVKKYYVFNDNHVLIEDFWEYLEGYDEIMDKEDESEVVDMAITPDGDIITSDNDEVSTVKEMDNSGEAVEDIMVNGTDDITDLPTTDQFTKELQEVYDMDESEIFQMLTILKALQNNEKISVYNAMPEKMKNLVMAGMASNNIPPTMENRNLSARALMEDILKDIKNDNEFINLEESLKEITKMPTLLDFHSENYKEIMEEKLIQVAEECKEEKPEISQSLLAIADSWKDTYTFKRIYGRLESSESARNSITKDVDKYYKKNVDNFLFKAEKSKYIINDISIMLRALNKFFGNKYPEYIYKAFISEFYYTTCGLDFNKPDDIAYIYFTIKNVISLEFVNRDTMLDFNKELVNNLEKLFDYIVELDKIYQEKLKTSNKKGKKRHGK